MPTRAEELERRRGARAPGRVPSGPRALALACLAGLALACCAVRPPEALELVDAGFRDPGRTFRSFRAALAADVVDLEYRCWSLRFRRDHQLSLFSYAEGREQLLEDRPWLRLFANAEVVSEERLAPDLHRIHAAVLGRDFELLLVREDFFELWDEEGLVTDGDADWDAWLDLPPGGPARARIPLEPGTDPSSATELRIGREWKIDALRELDDSPEPPAP